ncbi:acyl-CoA dehydrogenase family protein [Haliea salexigens]|jgi:alkylation response protein AidB-like acyl-CoA dehydrogenase|uniref:acyl-CoA dehydrogenase family protein n=1 Tax=Haliea salexigens TaxID=287487 RepID=UPI000401934B|nr:acyl-CoA dehydrogenase family protein [Haliea salexigens]|tara:strand:+ start:51713 stop:52882 length:1170 start_codon:yes stop_codon:yes gene_type:complete
MNLDLNPDQESFRQRVRKYMTEVMMTPDFVAELAQREFSHGGGPVYWEKLRQLGADGWIRLSWPKELGGDGADAISQYLLVDEAKRAGFPWPQLSANSIGPVLARHAQDAIRERLVTEILNGDSYLAIGYSEPGAGSDLAALKTRAERDGDDWVINGQKIWTSCANFAQYIWLAARTDPDPASRHKGLTVFLVPTNTPGYSHTLIETMGVTTTATYYDNVRIPDTWRISGINQGWSLITGQLNIERLSLASYGHVAKLYDQVLQLLQADAAWQPLLELPWVQRNLAWCHARLEALRVMCLQAAWRMDQGSTGMVEASTCKVYGSELFVEVCRRLGEILGTAGALRSGNAAALDGLIEAWYRKGSVLTFGGGANELQRTIIANAGLGLPR